MNFVYPSIFDAKHRCYFYGSYPPTVAEWLWKTDCFLWVRLDYYLTTFH